MNFQCAKFIQMQHKIWILSITNTNISRDFYLQFYLYFTPKKQILDLWSLALLLIYFIGW